MNGLPFFSRLTYRNIRAMMSLFAFTVWLEDDTWRAEPYLSATPPSGITDDDMSVLGFPGAEFGLKLLWPKGGKPAPGSPQRMAALVAVQAALVQLLDAETAEQFIRMTGGFYHVDVPADFDGDLEDLIDAGHSKFQGALKSRPGGDA